LDRHHEDYLSLHPDIARDPYTGQGSNSNHLPHPLKKTDQVTRQLTDPSVQDIPAFKTSQRSKHPSVQNIPAFKTSQRSKHSSVQDIPAFKTFQRLYRKIANG
jgi:hypothetical protein